MNNKKFENKDIGLIVGGAIIGAIAGFIVSRIGVNNIISLLKAKNIIPPKVADTINEFTSQNFSDK